MSDLLSPHAIESLLTSYGYVAILLGVAVDSFGVPVPGEVMLLTAAMYAGASHHLLLPVVILAAVAGAVGGDNLSFLLGRRGGQLLLHRYGYLLHLGRRRQRLARYLFHRYGDPVVMFGRFIPVVHVWTAFLAGTNAMRWRRFVLVNAAGCVLWASALATAGFSLGRVAVRIGGALVVLGPLLALGVMLLALLGVRVMERRLQLQADRYERSRRGAEAG